MWYKIDNLMWNVLKIKYVKKKKRKKKRGSSYDIIDMDFCMS